MHFKHIRFSQECGRAARGRCILVLTRAMIYWSQMLGTDLLGSRALGISVLFWRSVCHLFIQMFLFTVSLLTLYNSPNNAHYSFLRNRDLFQIIPCEFVPLDASLPSNTRSFHVLFICLACTVQLSWNSNQCLVSYAVLSRAKRKHVFDVSRISDTLLVLEVCRT
jgi:hypothetical protein